MRRGRLRGAGWAGVRRCRRHVRGHATTHQIVHDEAVEHPAQELLDVRRQGRAQAEDRVGRHASRRKDRGDERQPVRRAGHVPVGKPRTLVAGRPQQPPRRLVRRCCIAPTRESTRNGSICLPSMTGRPRAGGRKCSRSSVAFSSRPNAPPAARAAERRKQRGRTFDDREVHRRAEVGNGEVVA